MASGTHCNDVIKSCELRQSTDVALLQQSCTIPVENIFYCAVIKSKTHLLLYKLILPCDSWENGSDKPILQLPGNYQCPQQQTRPVAVFYWLFLYCMSL